MARTAYLRPSTALALDSQPASFTRLPRRAFRFQSEQTFTSHCGSKSPDRSFLPVHLLLPFLCLQTDLGMTYALHALLFLNLFCS